MPLKTQTEIHEFFDNSGRKEFMAISPKEGAYQRRHVKCAFPLLKLKIYRKSKLLKAISEIGASFQEIINIDRTHGRNIEDWKFVDGWDWFSITNEFARYVLKKEAEVKELFSSAKASSEMAFQTVLYNSEFRNNLFDIHDFRNGSSRFIDWQRGKPYTFRYNDYEDLINSPYMFARKFDEKVDEQIIEAIIRHVMKRC